MELVQIGFGPGGNLARAGRLARVEVCRGQVSKRSFRGFQRNTFQSFRGFKVSQSRLVGGWSFETLQP
jgi:hypothetical protein